MTRIPFSRLAAAFSAALRHTLQVRKRVSPSTHPLVALSNVRGVEATVNLVTGMLLVVNFSSGSEVKFPITVIIVSPAILCFVL